MEKKSKLVKVKCKYCGQEYEITEGAKLLYCGHCRNKKKR